MADDNVRLFPRMGAADPPADPPDDPIHTPLADPDPQPEGGPDERAGARRRSPLETLAALGEPPATEPPARSESEPEQEPAADGGEIPATFQSESWGHGSTAQPPDPGLGALSLAAVLAVSVAAMRGIHGALTGARASREQRRTVADLAASGRGDKSGAGKGISSSHDFGRRSLGRDRGGNRPGFFSGGGGTARASRRNGGGPGGFFGGGSSSRRGGTPGGLRSTSGLFGGGGSGRRGGTSGPAGSGGPGARKGAGPRSPRGSSSSGTASPSKTGTGGTGRTGTGGTGTGTGKADSGGAGKTSAGTGGGRGPRRTSQGAGWFRRTSRAKGPASSGGSSTGPGSSKTAAKGPAAKGKGPNPKNPSPTAKAKGLPPKGAGPKAKGPKASTGPKGTLRPKRPKNGRPGSGAAGGPPPRKRNGKPAANVSTRLTKLPKGYFHGTVPGWGQGCRCPACTRAWANSNAVVGTKVKGVKHGTIAAYEDDECRCRKCVKAAVRRSNARPPEPVTLVRAIGNTFERRWARRTQLLVSAQSPRTRRKAAKKATGQKKTAAAAVAAGGPVVSLVKKPRVNLRKKPGRTPPPGTAPGGTASGGTGPSGGHPGPSGPGATKHRRTPSGGHWSRERRRAAERAAGPAGPAEDEFWFTFSRDGRMRRTTPWESVAAATSGPEVVTGTEQLAKPGETGPPPLVEPLGMPAARPSAAPVPQPAPQAGAGAPIPEQRGAGMSLPAHILPTSMGMQSLHDTEVTIDDVLDVLERLTKESFTAHEKSIVIAEQARRIRGQLEDLAEELRTHHNVIGNRTAAAMTRLAESMDVVAAKADQMRTESLNAAEESESTQFAMADEHRPVQQATADANLVVPSARVHNEG